MSKKENISEKRLLANLPDVMEVWQMSEFLNISIKTGYKLLQDGIIGYLKIGRTYRIPKLHLISYLESCNKNKWGGK